MTPTILDQILMRELVGVFGCGIVEILIEERKKFEEEEFGTFFGWDKMSKSKKMSKCRISERQKISKKIFFE
ncbi:unnamed protein product [Meloidogyne enterolobii]|uniref:Uncharacterized protein n=1 Tax=Meloidogyne enterolobii TaxID=390850 RepID=A0ACB1A621_MELEN